jgi:DNA-directed RNA polymerase subunit RPC12/RpoP
MMTLSENTSYTCQYCSHKFSKEKTLAVHVCEQKRRALAKTERHVLLGYDTYNKFYRKTQNSKQDKTYDEFARSPYYNAFVKFGSFVSNVNPLYPERFMDYVVTSGVKLDHWCRDALYDQYVIDLIKKESVETALERSISHMMAWGENNNAAWNHYFLYVSLSRACFDIKDGKISPWLVLNSKNGKDMLKKFNDEQLTAINVIMDVPFWLSKFKRLPADAELVKQVIRESNI